MVEAVEIEEEDQCGEYYIQGIKEPANISQQVQHRVRVPHILVQVFVDAVSGLAYHTVCFFELLLEHNIKS